MRALPFFLLEARMTTIRQLIQTSPAKANELFAKLAETSENAVKTRERLFADLKEELELLARLEEDHIFPVLRKHKAMKRLVTEALDDNKLTRSPACGSGADAERERAVCGQGGRAEKDVSATCARREEGAAAGGPKGAE